MSPIVSILGDKKEMESGGGARATDRAEGATLEGEGRLRRSPSALPSVAPRQRLSRLPLSAAQLRWTNITLTPLHEARIPLVLRLEGRLNTAAFELAYRNLLQRHDIVRTVYASDEAGWHQIVRPMEEDPLKHEDLSDLTEEQQTDRLWERLSGPFNSQPDLSHPIIQATLFRIADNVFLFCGMIHHIAFDGGSSQIFYDELIQLYQVAVLGLPMPPKPQLQYVDFALWEAEWRTTEAKRESESFWEDRLSKARPIRLLGDHSGIMQPSSIGRLPFLFEGPSLSAILQFSQTHKTTPNVLLLAAVAIAVSRRCAKRAVAIGHIFHGRPAGFKETIGCFMQIRPFFLDLTDDPTIGEIVNRSRRAFLDATNIRNGFPPLSVSKKLNYGSVSINFTRNTSTFGRTKIETKRYMGIKPEIYRLPFRLKTQMANNLQFAVTQTSDGILGYINFAVDRFEERMISRLRDDVCDFMTMGILSEQIRLSEFEEKRLFELNRTPF
jgi:hypothetical protein